MGYQATIKKLGLSSVFDIKGDASAASKRISHLGLVLPPEVNTATKKDGQYLCWVGENHWLLLAPAEKENQLLDTLAPHDPAMDCRIVLVSDAYTFFTVTGNQADEILAIASPLDIRLTNFPETPQHIQNCLALGVSSCVAKTAISSPLSAVILT